MERRFVAEMLEAFEKNYETIYARAGPTRTGCAGGSEAVEVKAEKWRGRSGRGGGRRRREDDRESARRGRAEAEAEKAAEEAAEKAEAEKAAECLGCSRLRRWRRRNARRVALG